MIFGVGWHKTGTTSLAQAMKILGFRCWHYPYPMLSRLNNDSRLKDLLGDYDFCNDLPIPLYYRHLHDLFPEARFIFVRRDPQHWLESVERFFEERSRPRPELQGRSYWDARDPFFFEHLTHVLAYGQKTFDRRVFLRRYLQHEEDVLNYFAERAEGFLSLDLEGELTWQPICAFVGRPVPDVPFPTENEGTTGIDLARIKDQAQR